MFHYRSNISFWFVPLGLLGFLGSLVKGQNPLWILLDSVKYSYGIVAPVGWTVGAYTWYIGWLGLILGALLLLQFNKGWKDTDPDFGFFGRSQHFQRAFTDSGIFDSLDGSQDNIENHKLFWKDRFRSVAEKISSNS
ncbi:uncharacterized protein LOC131434385 [Malaya genurostris]|uniref:uncharacterized protein LOC131434385 n=1 Tax=Malaya genurostris TaxID=325434 RepID=UPI0026F3A147|nr:uncharacterized protein LOC131434385 [Malaya genurostris]